MEEPNNKHRLLEGASGFASLRLNLQHCADEGIVVKAATKYKQHRQKTYSSNRRSVPRCYAQRRQLVGTNDYSKKEKVHWSM